MHAVVGRGLSSGRGLRHLAFIVARKGSTLSMLVNGKGSGLMPLGIDT